MKLWMLLPVKKGYKKMSDIYDDASVIVRAETDVAARNLAQHEAIGVLKEIWANPELSICDELITADKAGVVVSSFVPIH